MVASGPSSSTVARGSASPTGPVAPPVAHASLPDAPAAGTARTAAHAPGVRSPGDAGPATAAPHPGPDERRRAVDAVLGDDAVDERLLTFRRVLAAQVDRLFVQQVLPVVRPVWPDVDRAPFVAKWRNGFDVYCSLALSCLVVSRRRPALVTTLAALARAARVGEDAIVSVGQATLPALFRWGARRAVGRAALASAWIMVLDEALDDGLADVPLRDRAGAIRALLLGATPTGGDAARHRGSVEVEAAAAIGRALRATLRGADDAARFADVVAAIGAWADGEVANLGGDVDPAGLCHRGVGVTASMDLLAWALGDACVGDVEREFLYCVASFGQMVDDWLDIDKDAAQGRMTPAVAGRWTPATMAATLQRGEALLGRLLDDVGETEGPWRGVMLRTFRGQLQHTARCLAATP
jgi:hypothetical protein